MPHPLVIDPLYESMKIGILSKLHSRKPLIYKYAGVAEIEYSVDSKVLKFEIPVREDNIKVFLENVNVSMLMLTEIADKMQWEGEPAKFVLFIPNNTGVLNELKNRIRNMWDLIVKLEAHTSVVRYINECIDETYCDIPK